MKRELLHVSSGLEQSERLTDVSECEQVKSGRTRSSRSQPEENTEGWLSGRKRLTANEVGVYSPSRVRIPYPPH